MAAAVPIRKSTRRNAGSRDTDDSSGQLHPFDQLPQALNPESGLIVTAKGVWWGELKRISRSLGRAVSTARIYDLLHTARFAARGYAKKSKPTRTAIPTSSSRINYWSAAKTVKPQDAALKNSSKT